jgi:hypothetical protein
MFKKQIYILFFILLSINAFCGNNTSSGRDENIADVEARAMIRPEDEFKRNCKSEMFIGITGAFGSGTKTPMFIPSIRFLYFPKSTFGLLAETEYLDYGNYGNYLSFSAFVAYKHRQVYFAVGPIFRIKLKNGKAVDFYNYVEEREYYSAHFGLGMSIGVLFKITNGKKPLKMTIAFDFKTGMFKGYRVVAANGYASNKDIPLEHYVIKVGIGF